MSKLYYRKNDPSDLRAIEDQIIVWQETNNPKANEWVLAPDKPSEDASWVNGLWVVPELTVYTAEQWVQNYYSSLEIIAFTRLEQNILQQGKILGPKMQACKEWLEAMMFAQPSSNFNSAPYTYGEASIEAVSTLNS
jgi:hypothetical protein